MLLAKISRKDDIYHCIFVDQATSRKISNVKS